MQPAKTITLPVKSPITSSNMEAAREQLRVAFTPIVEELNQYEMTMEKAQPVIDFAMKLFVRKPPMSKNRIIRKTVAEFHLKKIIADETH